MSPVRAKTSIAERYHGHEKAIVASIRSLREQEAVSLLREQEAVSLEEIGFVLGVGPGQISRYLSDACGTTLKNYLRIARALGYRCRIVFEKLEEDSRLTSDLKISAHRVLHLR